MVLSNVTRRIRTARERKKLSETVLYISGVIAGLHVSELEDIRQSEVNRRMK